MRRLKRDFVRKSTDCKKLFDCEAPPDGEENRESRTLRYFFRKSVQLESISCCSYCFCCCVYPVVYKVYKTLSDCKQYRRFNIARSLTRLDLAWLDDWIPPSSTRFSSSQRKLQISKQHAEHAAYQEPTRKQQTVGSI